jgi:16S rRNA (guanine966-N2)-methyltransferase
MFNILAHAYDDPCEGARVIDLFAGTGALGLEAVSRGAVFALFVDDSSEGRALLRANIETLGLAGVTRVFRRDATKLGPMPPQEPFTLAFLDPPYGRGLAPRALAALRDGGWLAEGALCVIEEEAAAAIDWPKGFTLLDRRESGDTQACFVRFAPRDGGGP